MKSTARRSKTNARGATSGELVRTTVPVALLWFYFWVLSPLGWPADFVFIDIVSNKFGDPESSLTPRYIGLALATVPTWLLWRTLSRCAGPLSDGSGLFIRSWFRSFKVPWDRVETVSWLEPGSGRNLRFSHTIVTFDADRPRRVVVSMSWRSGSAGAMRILSWAPPGHRLRQGLPPGWRKVTADQIADQVDASGSWEEVDESPYDFDEPDAPEAAPLPSKTSVVSHPAVDAGSLDELAGLSRPDPDADPIAGQPALRDSASEREARLEYDRYAATVDARVTDTLRPSLRSRRKLALGMGVVTLVALVGGLSMSADGTALDWGFAAALWCMGLVPVYAGIRALGLRIELSEVGMVVYGLLTTSVYPRAEIADIVVTDTGAGPMARLILAGRGSRALSAAGTGPSADEGMMRRLGQWLDETKHLEPDSTPNR